MGVESKSRPSKEVNCRLVQFHSDPDYDLSKAAAYIGWEPTYYFLVSRWLLVGATLLVVAAMLIPLLSRSV